MPYSVPPPPPPALVEVQPLSSDTDHVNQLSVNAASDNDAFVEHQQSDRPQTSSEPGWPSLLSAPDVFSTEFSGRSGVDAGTQLAEFDGGTADASLLGESFSLGSELHPPQPYSSQPLPEARLGATIPLITVQESLSTSPSNAVIAEQDDSVFFTTKPAPSLHDVLHAIQQAPPPPASELEIGESESVHLDDALLSGAQDVDAETARRSAQMSDDLKELAAQLLQPLEATFYELYAFAQRAEQASIQDRLNQEWIVQGSSDQSDSNNESSDDEDWFDESESSQRESSSPQAEESDIFVIPVEEINTDDVNREMPSDGDSDELSDDQEPETSDVLPPNGASDGTTENQDPDVLSQPEPLPTAGAGDAIELTSDTQIYDTERRVFVAEGNVEMIVRGAILNADRIQVNLPNKIAVAQGNVFFTRGEQVLRGDRIEYNLVLEEGSVADARGEIFLPGVSSDLETTRTEASSRADAPPLSDQLSRDQPPVETATSSGGVTIGGSVGARGGLQSGAGGGEVRKLRFEADTIDFYPEGWEATNVRITNDPFSPPELELRASRATFTRLSSTRSELIASRPRLVFDQGLSIPLLRRRFIFDEESRNAALFQFGFDEDDRGGVFVEREFEVLANPIARFSVRPQIFLQRAFDQEEDDDGEDFSIADAFGVIANLDVTIDQKTSLDARLEMTSLDFTDFDDEARASVRLNRDVLPINLPYQNQPGFHNLTAEYSFRDRLFNGTLGFQTVEQTYGLVLTSPTIQLTEPDIYGQALNLTYQGAIQRIEANVDADRRDDILGPPPRDNNRTTLTRYQAAAQLQRRFTLWRGIALPATPEEGLKYTPTPVVPFLALIPRLQGIASFYSNGDDQPILTGELTLQGQFGHFSRPYLDYLGFSLTYRRSTEGSESPFSFDRLNDREVVSGSLTAQIYGPFRAGVRTSISLDEDEEFDNSFFIEYSRRTYGIVLTYNPDREIGSLGLRISDFNWTGVPQRFDGSDDEAAGAAPAASEAVNSETVDSEAVDSETIEPDAADSESNGDSEDSNTPSTFPVESDTSQSENLEPDPLGTHRPETESFDGDSSSEAIDLDIIEPSPNDDTTESIHFNEF